MPSCCGGRASGCRRCSASAARMYSRSTSSSGRTRAGVASGAAARGAPPRAGPRARCGCRARARPRARSRSRARARCPASRSAAAGRRRAGARPGDLALHAAAPRRRGGRARAAGCRRGARAAAGTCSSTTLQPVVEVLPEARRRATSCGEVAVGRGDDAHVDRAARVLADAADLALLQHAQQLDLHRRRHLADLVEEQRAAVRRLEQARRGPASRR